ncbi:MAG: transposase [Verrucomicrobiaceae bacterium]|nr:transposase [Verrucomicrobiaceae bacterium]
MNHYRKTQRGGGLFSAIEHEQAVAAKTTGILKLRELIPWESFRPLLEELTGYATRDWRKGGKPPFDPVLMLKVLVLQKFHGLSDDATEEQIFDRTSFKKLPRPAHRRCDPRRQDDLGLQAASRRKWTRGQSQALRCLQPPARSSRLHRP